MPAAPPPRCVRLSLFGPMRLETGGQALAVPSGDVQRLLGYLAIRPGGHRRELVADALWPDADAVLRRLSNTIYRLRRRFDVELIAADGDTVTIAPDLATDLHEFDRFVDSDDLVDAEAAVALHGELLPGIYDDWAQQARASRRTAYVAALGRLAAGYEAQGALDQALRAVRLQIDAEPFDESAHQTYLRLLGRMNRYAEATSHYEALSRLLAEELGVVPLPATIAIVKRLEREREVAAIAGEDDTPFVGRAAERATGVRVVEAATAGRGGVLCVEGVAGIGKTRLVGELVGSARWRRMSVGMTDIGQVPEASSLSPLARALEPLLSTAVRMEIESRLDRETHTAVASLHPAWTQLKSADRTTGQSARMQHGLRAVGEVLARSGNVFIVLDDVHWASASTWDHLAAFADGFVPGGGLLVVAYRRPDIEETAGWSVLQQWERRGLATLLSLEPLQLDDVAALLGRDAADDAESVLAATGGIPFYIAQGLHDADWRAGTDVLTRARLDALAADDRAALEYAAVIGESVPLGLWVKLTGTPPLELAAVADRLAGARWLTPSVDGYAFTHELLRAAVDEQIDSGARAALHARAAAALAEAAPGNWRARAYHLDRAGRPVDAAHAYVQAGRASRAELAFSDARDAWVRALELLPARKRRQRLDLELEYADVCDVTGGGSLQPGVLTEAIELARELGDDVALLRALTLAGGLYWRVGDGAAGLRWLDEAEQIARRIDDPTRLADVFYRRGALLTLTGHWPEGEQEMRRAIELVDQRLEPELYGRLVQALGLAAVRIGRAAQTVGRLEDALAGYRSAGDSTNEIRVLAVLLLAYHELGDWDRLVETARASLVLARRFGDGGNVGICCQAIALAALSVGDRETARAMIADAEATWVGGGHRRMVSGAINTSGLIADDEGDEEAAIALYEQAIDVAREVDGVTEIAYASHDLGALHVEHGRPRLAIPLLRSAAGAWADAGNAVSQAKSEAYLGLALLDAGECDGEPARLADSGLQLLRSGDTRGEFLQAWLWALSRLLGRLGRTAEADEVLDAAHAELLRQAATIADPERRRGFFELVPLNRAIVAAVDARSDHVRTATVRLAAADAPLGRTLRPDELVDVPWTLHAPEDDAIDDPAERRRHRLRRLLQEAAAGGAAPTDDALATALGVSRRTILRDMATIEVPAEATTRRRGRGRELDPR